MLTIYAPTTNLQSKAWEVFSGVLKSWPEETNCLDNSKATSALANSMFWGFVGNNLEMIHKLEANKQQYWFADTPYFGRFDNANLKPDNHFWRMCKSNIHARFIKNCPDDRANKFDVNISNLRKDGKHILVCPSSVGIHKYINDTMWTNSTVEKLKQLTDRPIKIRSKPRGKGTSGPSVADVHIKDDLKDAWCTVTSCSISALESLCEGIPVICHSKSFAAPVCSTTLNDIDNPFYTEPNEWINSLCYQQFTPEEITNGTMIKIIEKFYS